MVAGDFVWKKRKSLHFTGALGQYRDFIVQHFSKPACNSELLGLGFVNQHFYNTTSQGANKGCVFFQNFELSANARQLNTINIRAEKLFFRGQYFKIHKTSKFR